MSKIGQQLLALVIVLVVAAIAAESRARQRYARYISGYWTAHPDFAETAALSEFQLFIAPAGANGARQGYLLIVDGAGKTLVNQAIDLRMRPRVSLAAVQARKIAADEFQGTLSIDYGAAPPPAGAPPDKMRISLSVLNGTLTLFDADRIFACLVKDLATTDSALRAYGSDTQLEVTP